jgi:hypothetical protein
MKPAHSENATLSETSPHEVLDLSLELRDKSRTNSRKSRTKSYFITQFYFIPAKFWFHP